MTGSVTRVAVMGSPPIRSVEAGRLGDQLEQVHHLDGLVPLAALLGEWALRPHTGAHERVHAQVGGALDPAAADLRGDVRALDAEAGAGAGAVRPLRHVVDVLEGQAGDRPKHLARRLVDSLALVEPAR